MHAHRGGKGGEKLGNQKGAKGPKLPADTEIHQEREREKERFVDMQWHEQCI